MAENFLSKLKSLFNNVSNKQSSKHLLPPQTDSEDGRLCMINYRFEDETDDDLLTVVVSRKPTISEAKRLVEKRNKSLIDTKIRTGEIFITNIFYPEDEDRGLL